MHPLVRPLLALAAVALLQSCTAQVPDVSLPKPECTSIVIENLNPPPYLVMRRYVSVSYKEPNKNSKLLIPDVKDFGNLWRSEVTACNFGMKPFLFKYDINSGQVHCNMVDPTHCRNGILIEIKQTYWKPWYKPTSPQA